MREKKEERKEKMKARENFRVAAQNVKTKKLDYLCIQHIYKLIILFSRESLILILRTAIVVSKELTFYFVKKHSFIYLGLFKNKFVIYVLILKLIPLE